MDYDTLRITSQDPLLYAHPKILQEMATLIERRNVAQIHFHVVENDTGYLPDSDPATFEAIDEAIEAVLSDAETFMDSLAQLPNDEIIRGQAYADPPKTAGQELSDVQAQVDEVRENLRTNEEFTTEVAQNGLLVVLDDGMRVIELSPCVDECLVGDQSHVENW